MAPVLPLHALITMQTNKFPREGCSCDCLGDSMSSGLLSRATNLSRLSRISLSAESATPRESLRPKHRGQVAALLGQMEVSTSCVCLIHSASLLPLRASNKHLMT